MGYSLLLEFSNLIEIPHTKEKGFTYCNEEKSRRFANYASSRDLNIMSLNSKSAKENFLGRVVVKIDESLENDLHYREELDSQSQNKTKPLN